MQSIQKQSRRGGESESTGETALNVIVDLNPNVKGLNFFFFFLRQRLSEKRLEKNKIYPCFIYKSHIYIQGHRKVPSKMVGKKARKSLITNIHSSVIYNSPDIEIIYMSIN